MPFQRPSALARSARLEPPDRAPGDDRPAPRGPSPSRAGEDEPGLAPAAGAERREDPFGKLNQTRESYSIAQQRQRTAARPPGSLLDFEA